MKQLFKLGFVFMLALSFLTSKAQSTATDFQVKDCAGINRHLFAELDAGKVIVLSMVHPCVSCVAPTKTAIDVVNTFANSHPARVLFYLTDDVGNTPCNSLNSWASTYGISGVTILSDPSITQADYGSSGMPKILVLGGSTHKVLLNQDNGINSNDLTAAIQSALLLSGLKNAQQPIAYHLYPNPATDKMLVDIELPVMTYVKYELIDVLGNVVYENEGSYFLQGKHEINISVKEMSRGIYFFKVCLNQSCATQKVWVN